MQTKEALTRFMQKCQERGLSPETRRTYYGYLRHFADDYPELPTDEKVIDRFLRKRHEPPKKRGSWFKQLQAFYSYLATFEGITSPVPKKGDVGRPKKVKSVTNPATTQIGKTKGLPFREISSGGSSVLTSTSISTEDAVRAFETQRHHAGLRPRTFEVYHSIFTPFIRRYPTLPLEPGPIEEFIGSIQGQPETRAKYQRTIRALYTFMWDRYDILKRYGTPDPFKKIKKYKVPRKLRATITLDQFKQLHALPMSFHDRALLVLLSDIGLRAGEICSLRREDVKDGYVTLRGKTGQSEVPISKETEDMLVQLAPSGLLFHTPKGPMNIFYLYKIVRRWLEAIGVTEGHLGPHRLRHTFGRRYIELGGDLMSLSQILGHTSVSTTQVYAEMAKEGLKVRHDQASPLRDLAPGNNLVRAKCYGCEEWVMMELDKVKETKCPGCGQVGKWYLPNHQPAEEELGG